MIFHFNADWYDVPDNQPFHPNLTHSWHTEIGFDSCISCSSAGTTPVWRKKSASVYFPPMNPSDRSSAPSKPVGWGEWSWSGKKDFNSSCIFPKVCYFLMQKESVQLGYLFIFLVSCDDRAQKDGSRAMKCCNFWACHRQTQLHSRNLSRKLYMMF